MSKPRTNRPVVFALVVGCLAAGDARTNEEGGGVPLQLEVFINGDPTNLVASFVQRSDGSIAVAPAELREIGLATPPDAAVVVLDQMPGIAYSYDEAAQAIHFTVKSEARATNVYDLRQEKASPEVRTDTGAVLNYSLFGNTDDFMDAAGFAFAGASLSLDGRIFSPLGTFSQSAMLNYRTAGDVAFLRGDSSYGYSHPGTMLSFTAGDFISGGLPWTRPVRLGGLQLQRNFSLRPDLVTIPLPTFSGTAAVPSTAEIYVNNVRRHTQDVEPGPYEIRNFPVINGFGEAVMVLRDASGRATETNWDLFVSPRLLASGLLDFSIDAGYPRFGFGTPADSYMDIPIVSATGRYGLTERLTIEGHGEWSPGLVNGGTGGVFNAGRFGLLSAAVSGSQSERGTGMQARLAYETELFGWRIAASTQQSFGQYEDVASLTARLSSFDGGKSGGSPVDYTRLANIDESRSRPLKRIDQVTIGLPKLTFDEKTNIGLSFVNVEDWNGERSRILSASWSRSFDQTSVYASAYADVGDRNRFGIYAGISMQFGGVSSSLHANSTDFGTELVASASKSGGTKPGDYGWRFLAGRGQSTRLTAGATYTSGLAKMQVDAVSQSESIRASAEIEGAITVMDSDVFLSNRIDDAFAVVDTGTPGITVEYENRYVGKTGRNGKFLVPGLRPYERNTISIDPKNLPATSSATTTREIVAPAYRSGIVVDFAVEPNEDAAIVEFVDAYGTPIPAGAEGTTDTGTAFVVGFDGQAFIQNLGPHNTMTVKHGDEECRASFAFTPIREKQTFIPSVTCQ